jgi:hypothetical protein
MPSLTIRLPEHAAAALQDLAQVECRTPRDQAAFLVLEGLRAAASATAVTPTARRRGRLGSARTNAAVARVEP